MVTIPGASQTTLPFMESHDQQCCYLSYRIKRIRMYKAGGSQQRVHTLK